MGANKYRLTEEEVRNSLDPALFDFPHTGKLDVLDQVIGQDRAVRAISFGIGIESPGYHLYAMGPPGTGKSTTIRKFLEKKASTQKVPDDWCYVYNFSDPDYPRALRLPAGRGHQLRDDINQMIDRFRTIIPKVFQKKEYNSARQTIQEKYLERQRKLLSQLEARANKKALKLIQTPQGITIVPVKDGEPLTPEELEQLDDQEKKKVKENQQHLQQELQEILRKVQKLEIKARKEIQELDKQSIRYAVEQTFEELKNSYGENKPVANYLTAVEENLLENIAQLKKDFGQDQDSESIPGTAQLINKAQKFQPDHLERYKINLLVDNSKLHGAPVILEENPTLDNLIGRIEHQAQMGALITNYQMIKAGALHQANGGYLLLEAKDLLSKKSSWPALKRALKNKRIKIENPSRSQGVISTQSLNPEAIPLNVKVFLIGDSRIYYLLYSLDDDFQEIFKVKADFARDMIRNQETAYQYAQFIATICAEQDLKHFTPTGVARLIEESSRMVSQQNYLTTRFGEIVDLIQQASYWAEQNGKKLVDAEQVDYALRELTYRSDRLEELVQRMIEESTILITTTGAKIGQINGISYLSLGDYAFGKPSRISCTTHVGKAGVVNIERETKLGGKIHNKGVMILTGYLGGRYAEDFPLALSARIAFEQQYSSVDGDSASSAELYALLSSLSGYPLRQDLAVTGSVNQNGQVQAIGGVNQKIEGFFKTCQIRGLSGSQGVIIPRSNVKNLCLRDEVRDAVSTDKFHIYAVDTVDQGISLLTGKEAGVRQSNGKFPAGTVNRAVVDRLRELAEKVKNYDQETRDNQQDEEQQDNG
ncbi:MAG: AAA family ATPase [Anaerolineales bacterium]|nr:AAA family ATPase [Anaerolineales bacterium]